MSEDVPLCVHWSENCYFKEKDLEGKKIFKEQCLKCFNDLVIINLYNI